MNDIAEVVISQLRLDDEPSFFELLVTGFDRTHPQHMAPLYRRPQYCEVLRVRAPVESGRRVFQLEYLDNHRAYCPSTRCARGIWTCMRAVFVCATRPTNTSSFVLRAPCPVSAVQL